MGGIAGSCRRCFAFFFRLFDLVAEMFLQIGRRIVLQLSRIDDFFRFLGRFQHVLFVHDEVVRVEWTQVMSIAALSIEMFIIFNRFPTYVTHNCTTRACHFVTAFLFDELGITLPALSYQRLSHFVLNIGPSFHSLIFLHLITPQWHVRWFLAQPAGLLHAVRIETTEQFVFGSGNSGEIAERTRLEFLYASRFHFGYGFLLGDF